MVLQRHEAEQGHDPEGLGGVHPAAEEGPGPPEDDGGQAAPAGDEQQEDAPQDAGEFYLELPPEHVAPYPSGSTHRVKL